MVEQFLWYAWKNLLKEDAGEDALDHFISELRPQEAFVLLNMGFGDKILAEYAELVYGLEKAEAEQLIDHFEVDYANLFRPILDAGGVVDESDVHLCISFYPVVLKAMSENCPDAVESDRMKHLFETMVSEQYRKYF